MSSQKDLVVIGAGPAGLAAACSASKCGLEVALVEEHASPGGQLFRNIETPLGRSVLDAKEREMGIQLAQSFRDSGVEYYPKTMVWGLEPRAVFCVTEGRTLELKTSSVVIAPGAMERPVPFPGWTLPGVMGAGGADILLRSRGKLTEDTNTPVVLAGNGPLLLLLACHLIERGIKIAAWLDTGYWSRRLLSGLTMPAALFDSPYLGKGLSMALKIIRGKIPLVTGVTNLEAKGTDRLEEISYEVMGVKKRIKTQCLLRHEGVIPRTHILNSLGAKHLWDPLQRYWYPALDDSGRTSLDGIFLAGDAGYVHGGDASITKGTLAGIAAAKRLKVISDNEAAFRSKSSLKKLRITRFARGFLRYVFAPNPNIFRVPDTTIVCRCECITAGDIRKVASEGNKDINEVKLFTRCGMGPCQGRMCGPALAELTAGVHSTSPKNVGTLQIRQPFRPITLETYCNRSFDDEKARGN